MSSPGRPVGGVRKYFDRVTVDDTVRMRCSFCSHTCCVHPITMTNHLMKCEPAQGKAVFDLPKTKEEISNEKMKKRKRSDSLIFDEEFNDVRPWTPEDNETARVLLSQALFDHDIPWKFVESSGFKNFIAKLNPCFTPQTRHSLSEVYLDKEYQRLQDLIAQETKGDLVTLIPDGSTDGCQEPITHIMAVGSNNIPYLHKVLIHTTEKHTTENLVDKMVECVNELEEANVGVKGIISDNEIKMVTFRQRMKQKYDENEIVTRVRKYPFFAIPGDAPHGLQLVLGDIFDTPQGKELLQSAQFIAEKFKNTRLRQFLKQALGLPVNQRVGHSLGVITRWGSHFKMLHKLITRREKIMAILHSNDPIVREFIHQDLEDTATPTFWRMALDFEALVKPIDTALTKLEADGSIGVVLREFTLLDELYHVGDPTDLTEYFPTLPALIVDFLKDRWNLITDDIYAAAFLVDPRWRGMAIAQADYLDGERILKLMAGPQWQNLEATFQDFRDSSGLFSGHVNQNGDPKLMWRRAKDTREGKQLADIALYLLSYPMSAVSVERSFSVVRHIHTWKRNRLGRENLAKLTYIRVNRQWELRQQKQ
eukprot:TRINITY_DN2511_c0_g1_i5.p1 TRINITY_DN2511_c0_g1~~TRINITY_DN2511_c0_g1_i5.p1  ORF type:complete len:594 (-),score=80.92 TRINITY_DN2511_c0_g1_i5:2252-4033(-)